MLYYATNLWRNWGPVPAYVDGYRGEGGVTFPLPHRYAEVLSPADGNA